MNIITGYQLHKRVTNTEMRMSIMEMNQQQSLQKHEEKYNHRYKD